MSCALQATRHGRRRSGPAISDEVSGGDVIEEGKGRSAVYQDVIDGVIDEIFANGVVDPGGGRNQHLRPTPSVDMTSTGFL